MESRLKDLAPFSTVGERDQWSGTRPDCLRGEATFGYRHPDPQSIIIDNLRVTPCRQSPTQNNRLQNTKERLIRGHSIVYFFR